MVESKRLIFKQGQVVVLTSGKHAGKKGIVVINYCEGTKTRKFAHCLIAGIARYPRKITKNMSEKKISRRIKQKSFVQYVNHNQLILTRYVVATEKGNSFNTLEKKFVDFSKGKDDKKPSRDPL